MKKLIKTFTIDAEMAGQSHTLRPKDIISITRDAFGYVIVQMPGKTITINLASKKQARKLERKLIDAMNGTAPTVTLRSQLDSIFDRKRK